MWEKWNALQISFYGIDESEQKVFNNRSGIKMTHLYCMNYSDWFAFFISILTTSIVELLQNGYQPDLNQTTKSCIVKSLTLWIRSRYKKSNAGQDESLQKTFSNLKENYSLVLYELTCIWLNYFYLYQWTSPILGISTEIVISLKSNNKKLHTPGGLKGLSDCGVRMLVWAQTLKYTILGGIWYPKHVPSSSEIFRQFRNLWIRGFYSCFWQLTLDPRHLTEVNIVHIIISELSSR